MFSCPECTLKADSYTPFANGQKECTCCGGIWLKEGDLKQMCQTHVDLPYISQVLIRASNEHILCPQCSHAELKRLSYSPWVQIELEWCPSCKGIWIQKEKISQIIQANTPIEKNDQIGVTLDPQKIPYTYNLLSFRAIPDSLIARVPMDDGVQSRSTIEELHDQFKKLLYSSQRLIFQQHPKGLKVLEGLHQHSHYSMHTQDGDMSGACGEWNDFFGAKIEKFLLKKRRSLKILIVNKTGQPLAYLERRARILVEPQIRIFAAGNVFCGHSTKKSGLMSIKYDLFDANGNMFAKLIGSRPNSKHMQLLDSQNNTIGTVTRTASDASADLQTGIRYEVDFLSTPFNPSQRSVIMATSISIERDYFH